MIILVGCEFNTRYYKGSKQYKHFDSMSDEQFQVVYKYYLSKGLKIIYKWLNDYYIVGVK